MSTNQQFNRNLDLTTSASHVSAAEVVTGYMTLNGVRSNVFVPDNSVTSAKIVNGAIIAEDLASNSVVTNKILNGNITTAKIADENVTYDKLHRDVREKRLLNARAWANLSSDSSSVGFFNITTGWNQHPTGSFIYDPYSQFNEVNGIWTCPETGYYRFNGSVMIEFWRDSFPQPIALGDVIQSAFRITRSDNIGNPVVSTSERIDHFDVKAVICTSQNFVNPGSWPYRAQMRLSFDWQGGPLVIGEYFCLQLSYAGRIISGTGALETPANRPVIYIKNMDFNVFQILEPTIA